MLLYRKFHTAKIKHHNNYNQCQDCGVRPFTPYMIRNGLWQQVSNGCNLLCLPCFVKRLGRPLHMDDFHPCQLTNLIMLGYAIATGEEIDMTEQ